MRVIAVIPARFSSTRLPGKPLKDICGKPMIWWIYHSVKMEPRFDQVLIATDHEEIFNVCTQYDMDVVMTQDNHPTAIHRLAEVAVKHDADMYVQVNGDEPLLPTKIVSEFLDYILSLKADAFEKACGVNAIAKIHNPVEVMDTANIKMVFNEEKICAYMSRTPIPFPFKTLDYDYYKHIGLIGYTKPMLHVYMDTVPGHFERIEGIDLLRFIDYGKQLYLVEVEETDSLSVDTEKDLEEVRKRMQKRKEK